MLVDSHCHLDRVDLTPFAGRFDNLIATIRDSGVGHMLCVSIDLESYPEMLHLVEPFEDISISVGVHPNDKEREEPAPETLVKMANHEKNVAIGETGLDYYRGEGDLEWQRSRFRRHIRAARTSAKPLIIHTRAAREDTISIMKEEKARDAGGVMHCFTEDWEMARKALDMGFYISFSGIITFKTADELREVAKHVPLDRLLIETDAPYLAPVPKRGKPNVPAYVTYVAACIADIRGMDRDQVEETTTANFFRLFKNAKR